MWTHVRLLLISLFVCLLCASCLETAQYGMAVLTGPDIEEGTGDSDATNEFVARAIVKDGQLKFGYQSHWWESDDPHQTHGLFISHDLVADPNGNGNALGLLGTPYIGGATTFGSDGEMYGPYIGTEHVVQGVVFNTEFHVRTFSEALDVLDEEDTDQYKFIFGPVFYFPRE